MLFSCLILFICALLAFALSSVCGGGASFILLPLLGWLLPGAQVPAALSLGTASSSLSRIAFFWSNIRWSIVLWFVPPAIPAVWLGAWLLTFMNPLYLELLLGLFLLTNLPLIFRPAVKDQASRRMPKLLLSLIGIAAGFISGLTGAVGLLFNRFYLRYGLTKEEIVATRAANELVLHLIKLGLYASFGLLTARAIGFGAVVALAAIASSWIMKRLLPYLSEKLFQRIGYTAMVASGIMMFSNASVNLVSKNNMELSYKPIADGTETKLRWKQTTFALELEFDEGFEFEHTITLADIPAGKQGFVKRISEGADKVLLEEVYGIGKHYYEAYVYKNGKLLKYDI